MSAQEQNVFVLRAESGPTSGVDERTIAYFKALSNETGIRYQTLINFYLRDCATTRNRLAVAWRSDKQKGAA